MISETRRSELRGAARRWAGRAAVIAAVMAVAPAWAADPGRGTCVSVRLDAPVVLPDGRSYEARALRICDATDLTPVSSLHITYVDGLPVGLLASERKRSEAGSETMPSVLFHRDAFGRLQLLGYVLPGRDFSVSYAMARPSSSTLDVPQIVAAPPPPSTSSVGLVAMSR